MKFNKKLLALIAAILVVANAAQTSADTVLNYECEYITAYINVSLYKDQKRAQISYGGQSIPTVYDGRNAYVNTFEQVSFNPTPDGSNLRIDNKLYGCTENFDKAQNNERSFSNQSGMSLGGTLRAGPGTDFPKVGSLAYGAKFNIKTNSGVSMGGYDWFTVRSGKVASYQWGGIMCSDNIKLEGIFQRCPQKADTNAYGPYMAFAIASDRTFGHAISKSQNTVVETALKNCGQSSCKVEIISTSKCHTYALATDNSLWFGEGNVKADADDLAMGYCLNGGRGCRQIASFCQ
jgi:hypothetical protein